MISRRWGRWLRGLWVPFMGLMAIATAQAQTDPIGDTRFPVSEWASYWTYFGIDPTGVAGDVIAAQDAAHPFWQATVSNFYQTEFCYPYPSDGAPQDEPYSTFMINPLMIGAAHADRYLTEQGFNTVLPVAERLPGDEGQTYIPVFCRASQLPAIEGFRPRALESGYGGFVVERDFAWDADDRDWLLAGAEAVSTETILNIFSDSYNQTAGQNVFLDTTGAVNARVFDHARWIASGLSDGLTLRATEALDGERFGEFSSLEDRFSFLPGRYSASIYRPNNQTGEDYTAGAFWWFLAEHYLEQDGEFQAYVQAIQTNADYFGLLDRFIDERDGDKATGLGPAYAQFVAHYLNWPSLRFDDLVNEETWLDDVIDDCETVVVSETETTDKLELKIPEYGSACVDFVVEAEGEAWTGAGQLRLYGPNDKVADLHIAYSAFQPYGGGQVRRCEGVDAGDLGNTACIVADLQEGRDPETGRLHWYTLLDQDTELRQPGADAGYSRYVFAYVPREHPVYTQAPVEEQSITFELDLSVDATIVNALFEEDTAFNFFASKQGLQAASPGMTRQQGAPDRSVFAGDSVPVDPNLFGAAMGMADYLFGVADEAGTSLSVQLMDPSVLDSKAIGEFEFIPVFSQEDTIAIHNPDEPSRITIIEHNQDTFQFDVSASICMMDTREYEATVLRGEAPDICGEGNVETVEVSASVPTPDAHRQRSRPQPEGTPAFLALRELRLARVEQAFAQRLGGAPFQSQGPSRPGQPGAPSTPGVGGAGGSGSGGSSLTCPVREPDGACDCSCEARACLQTRTDAGTASAQERSCRLTCGRAWMQCPAP